MRVTNGFGVAPLSSIDAGTLAGGGTDSTGSFTARNAFTFFPIGKSYATSSPVATT